ncbi:2-oxoacid:acceptor oxidoreductase subunit alpha [Winogradskyella sp.]|uniref:2-oxoacid:acceptor oxidoreductase subunit alpha n=1 Tax=Winogradskyella sp. TaxID=1883156 RepID=UPI00262C997A|nr:2-oxoacid:acceptor oxidoreductase subunit alpha [Winogradskyella sp.]
MKNVLEHIVILFSGDSGDGIQLTGSQFSGTSAKMGNDIATFPDYPSEIRAPSGTTFGVSGFQVHIGAKQIYTPGDRPDVLVAMNPAALKVKLPLLKKGATIIIDDDAFNRSGFKKAGYNIETLNDLKELQNFKLIHAPITSQTQKALSQINLDNKSKRRCKNFYALGLCYFMFSRNQDTTKTWIKEKFKGNKALIEANIKALEAGYHYAETIETSTSVYHIPEAPLKKGIYRQINGNLGIAWGLMQAAEASGLDLFLGSYPITPATEILQELSKRGDFGVKTFQAEDEIAAICASIGASFSGALAATTTSGPGLALKSEALNLAVMLELPIVVVNVQRGGPSTGLPTKTEQADLLQTLYGRNGESPLIVVAASGAGDTFDMAFHAARLSLEHMTPVVLLSDGYIANSSEPWRIPDFKENYNHINTNLVETPYKAYKPYARNKQMVRPWAIPGMPFMQHRIGGLEKDYNTGEVSYVPENHEKMVEARAKKLDLVTSNIPKQTLEGKGQGKLLIISWGSTYGAIKTAVNYLQEEGHEITLAHLKYLNPFPSNLSDIVERFERILIPELNKGQLLKVINAKYHCNAKSYSKIQGLPFTITELINVFKSELEHEK